VSSTSSQSEKNILSKMAAFVSTPSIPGKTQRILINKRRSTTTTAVARIFNRSQMGSKASGLNKSFNSSGRRFDAKQEIKEAFNKEPGPGSYSCPTAATSTMSLTSTQGFGNGFVSKQERFKEVEDEY